MEQHFNDLTPAEQERLVILVEECAEVQAIAGKVLRHGYLRYHPEDPAKTPNRILLERELGDLLFSARWVQEEDLDATAVNGHVQARLTSVRQYTHHQNWQAYDLVHLQMAELAPLAAEPRTFAMQRQATGLQGAIFHGFVPPEDEQRRYVYKVVLRADDDRGLQELLDVWLSLRSVYGANGEITRTK